MEIGQLNRSALRRALHTYFFEAVESMLQVSHKRGKIETRFNTSWRWCLTICSLFQQGILDHNSSYFYWYWRIYGNGFQISTRDIMNIPIPKITNQEIFQNKIDNMANLLHKKREILSVTKSNNGMIRNIKYDLDPILINKLDDLILKLFDWF
jgi:hypothetical protein